MDIVGRVFTVALAASFGPRPAVNGHPLGPYSRRMAPAQAGRRPGSLATRPSAMPCPRPPDFSDAYCYGGHCGLDCKSPFVNISRVKSPVRPRPARPTTARPSDHRSWVRPGRGEPGAGGHGCEPRKEGHGGSGMWGTGEPGTGSHGGPRDGGARGARDGGTGEPWTRYHGPGSSPVRPGHAWVSPGREGRVDPAGRGATGEPGTGPTDVPGVRPGRGVTGVRDGGSRGGPGSGATVALDGGARGSLGRGSTGDPGMGATGESRTGPYTGSSGRGATGKIGTGDNGAPRTLFWLVVFFSFPSALFWEFASRFLPFPYDQDYRQLFWLRFLTFP